MGGWKPTSCRRASARDGRQPGRGDGAVAGRDPVVLPPTDGTEHCVDAFFPVSMSSSAFPAAGEFLRIFINGRQTDLEFSTSVNSMGLSEYRIGKTEIVSKL